MSLRAHAAKQHLHWRAAQVSPVKEKQHMEENYLYKRRLLRRDFDTVVFQPSSQRHADSGVFKSKGDHSVVALDDLFSPPQRRPKFRSTARQRRCLPHSRSGRV